jgi:glycyl-tRNA synthetase beta chain
MDFLFEIGLEEVPARMIASAQAELLRRLTALLERERLVVAPVDGVSYSTPRRLAVLVRGISARQEDLSEEVLGPAVKIAFQNGVPGPAAIAFAKKSGVEASELKIVSTPKGEYVAATSVKAGRAAAEVIATELPKELAGIYWAKNMVWRAGKPERFVRPVRWLVALLGDEVVPVSFGGYEAGRVTYGHRVLFGPEPITIESPESYLAQLAGASVMVDVEFRRHTIRKALDRVCRTIPGTRWREDHALVDKMTHLTEWPSVIAGNFEPEFLALPEEVLVTVMRDHQNYFAVETVDGKLAPHFLAVLNTVADEAGEAVIRHGNARVLRARFNDARFFWEFDQRIPLTERVALLENVTFHKDIGSYADKTKSVSRLCDEIRPIFEPNEVDWQSLAIAASLAKTDLTTELVKEFTELQGQIGGLYAKQQGFSQVTADAIYDQYLPVSMEDSIPRTVEGQLLSLADKADTIAKMFKLGLEPTGSRDPFALRRAANGIVKILAESKLPLSISKISKLSTIPLLNPTESDLETGDRMMRFLNERLDFYLREVKGQAYDVVKAVLVAGSDDVRDAVARAEAVTAVRDSADFAAVSAAFKRIKNILAQATTEVELAVPEDGFADISELELNQKAGEIGATVKRLTANREYVEALTAIASLRLEIDRFFERVMVMDPDPIVRSRRLAMLRRIVATFSGIADFSEIVVAG